MAHKRKDTLAKVVSNSAWRKHLRGDKRAQAKLERIASKKLIGSQIKESE